MSLPRASERLKEIELLEQTTYGINTHMHKKIYDTLMFHDLSKATIEDIVELKVVITAVVRSS